MKHAILTVAMFVTIAASASGQGGATPQNVPTNIDSYIESLRADFRADKVSLITQTMQFNDKQSAAFWPVYRRYEAELTTLNDGRVKLIKQYADKYETLTDAEAKVMVEKSFVLESSRTDLKKKYFKEFTKVLPALTVAKFFQLEHRLDLLVNLQLASELPLLLLVHPAEGGAGQGSH